MVASNIDDLTDGTVRLFIDRTAANVQVTSAPEEVWTGTLNNGNAASDRCGAKQQPPPAGGYHEGRLQVLGPAIRCRRLGSFACPGG